MLPMRRVMPMPMGPKPIMPEGQKGAAQMPRGSTATTQLPQQQQQQSGFGSLGNLGSLAMMKDMFKPTPGYMAMPGPEAFSLGTPAAKLLPAGASIIETPGVGLLNASALDMFAPEILPGIAGQGGMSAGGLMGSNLFGAGGGLGLFEGLGALGGAGGAAGLFGSMEIPAWAAMLAFA